MSNKKLRRTSSSRTSNLRTSNFIPGNSRSGTSKIGNSSRRAGLIRVLENLLKSNNGNSIKEFKRDF
ncbi:hypothetical protein QUF81_24615 [Peribacillus simplex]|uniref:Uncharacterized protein n=1 Tax=Peribacillus simplex TaxID=1478 RepID=A0AAW7IYL0_9BACI|nr:hypothetical protein [Peribacillus simplex]MDM5296271.1 hypothetical protein [Peribacillus simplex]MDM5455307.1 hypothetical protein [Peribacillus simplex]